MSNYLKLSALALGLVCAGQVTANSLTAVSFGGANKQAQGKAFYQPWEAAGHGRIIAGEYNGEMAKVKAMVDTNSVSWNLVEVESPELSRGCDEGLFEELDPGIVGNPDDFVEGAIQPCGVGFFVWSTVLAYNADKLKSAPSGCADFWDTENSPASAACARAPSTPSNSRLWPTVCRSRTSTRCWPPRTGRTAPSESSISSNRTSSGGKPARSRRSSSPQAMW
jgi:spermidine/putrescine-binding protein